MRTSEANDCTYKRRPGWSVGHQLNVPDVLSPNLPHNRHSTDEHLIPATSTAVGAVLVA
jgi:hypothetical protein